jgi:hypothetical protein
MSESYIQLPPDSTGKKVRAIYNSDLDSYEEVQAFKHIEEENPVYVTGVEGSSVAADKHHLTIWNGSSSYIRILKVLLSMHETATVSGYVMGFFLYRADSVSGGTPANIIKLDPRDPDLPRGISAYTGATVTTIAGNRLALFALNPEETGAFCFIDFTPPKPIVVPPNQGVTLKQYSYAGVGLFNAVIYFSVEVVKP